MAFEDLAPVYRVVVSGHELNAEVLRSVISIDVDLSRDMADQIKLRVANPSSDQLGRGYAGGQLTFIDTKVWMPGNQLDVYAGYGSAETHICSGIVQKWLPTFPSDGVPTLDIVALDASTRLMDADTSAVARSYPHFDLDTIVLEVINRHDIDPGEVTPLVGTFQQNLTKKAGMTDYQFVKGLANLCGYEFKIRYDPVAERWKAYWRPPTSDQEVTYTFTYMAGVATLLDFDAQWGLRDAPSEVKVLYFDESARIWQELSSKDISAAIRNEVLGKERAKGSSAVEDLAFLGSDEVVRQEILSLEKIRIGAGGTSVEVVPERSFQNAETAERFAARWLRAHRDNFITGRGTVVGLETLRPGDIHRIEGIGVLLSGEWEMTSVRHVMSVDTGFRTEFSANKVIDV